MLIDLEGAHPRLGAEVFVADTARIIGDVVVGERSSVWYAVTLRGDLNSIRIGARTNVQDGSTVHVTGGTGPVAVGDDVTVGHNCVLHACTVEDRCIVGMGAVVLDNAVVGHGSIVGASALVTQRTRIPPRSMVLGSPAKVVRPVTDEEYEQILENARHYLDLGRRYRAQLQPAWHGW